MEKFILFADNNDLSVLIYKFEVGIIDNKDYNTYFEELQAILSVRNVNIDIYSIIKSLLLEAKVNEYTLNDNRLYSFNQVADIVLSDKRTNYLKDVLTYNQIIELGFVILQAKHIASINKIRLELESTSTELILEKYIDCLNYYILYELYVKTVEKIWLKLKN